jgi:ABC-type amino acid transport system permease subunit
LRLISRKEIQGFRSILAWIHLLGMNVGGATVTLTIAYAGLIGSGVIGTILSGGNISELKPNTQIMEEFIIPISIFAAVLVIGLIAGGLSFLLNYLGHKKKAANTIMK